jgi:outer membrane protein assembly factor BamA
VHDIRTSDPLRVSNYGTRTRAALLALGLTGCAARIDRSRLAIENLRLHGVRRVDEGDLRNRIATQQTSRTLGIRLPWTDPQYYDETSFRRDLDRIERYYAARGYYSAAVQGVRLDTDPARRRVDIDLTIREGEPTRLRTLWISGCEPASRDDQERWRPSDADCDRIRSRMQLREGAIFTEAAFDADKSLITDLLRDAGHAAARVFESAIVDPVLHEAHVIFVLRPGPTARFGQLYLHESPDEHAMQDGRLRESHYPVRVALRATGIREGSAYNRHDLVDAQRRLFDLGVFGIVRIDEENHVCDSHNRCDAAADRDDPREYVRVDLHVHVSPTRPYRVRAGGGFEIDQSRSDLHLLASFEHSRIPFLGRMARWRIDERPLVFTPLNFGGVASIQGFNVGNLLFTEFRIPEVWPSGTLLANVSWDIGPDPINPNITNRSAVRGSFGALFRFTRQLLGAAYVRGARLDYCGEPLRISCEQSAELKADPIFSQQYIGQTYTYLEQQLTWDTRDNPLQTRRGFYASIVNQESVAIPPVSDYGFLRGALDVRGFIPIGNALVLAVRGFGGTVIGLNGGRNGWPVPTELRFYSGGALSNRGYAFNQVGWRTSIPVTYATDPLTVDTTTHIHDQIGPNEARFSNVGGLTAWEFSTELRWYFPPFGLAFFFDASDVTGWDPGTIPRRQLYVDPHDPNFVPVVVPPPTQFQVRFDPHPSTGFGIRYISPIGVVRLDFGIRLDDLAGCFSGDGGRYAADIAAANAVPGGYPAYYAVSRPKCDFFGLPVPLAFHFAIGEAY